LLATVLLATALLCGCAQQHAAGSASKPTPGPTTLALGQGARVGDITVTLNAVRIIPPIAYVGPSDGSQYLAGDFTATNETDAPYTLSIYLSCAALDRDGRKYEPTPIPPDQQHGTLDGVIPPHGSVRGEVVFSVPIASAPYQLRFIQPVGTTSATWQAPLP
jgi:hypothetical protein